MNVLTYRIRLLEPTLVTELDGDPNSAVAFNYLPGSVLRGALIGRYAQQHNPPDLATDPDARRLFFNATTRFLNGYLLDRMDKRSLPVPLSWQHKKDDESSIYDFAVRMPDDPFDTHDALSKRQWQRVHQPFCRAYGDEAQMISPERHMAIHTARTRRFGRAMPDSSVDPGKGDMAGAIYCYESLAAHQTFEAAILCETESDAQTLAALIEGAANLGGSRSGGYGRADFFDVNTVSRQSWHEYPKASSELDDDSDKQTISENESEGLSPVDSSFNGTLITTFLSDTLLRDEMGQFLVSADSTTNYLQAILNCKLTLERAFVRQLVIGGFNRKWGLPLPQSPAIQMGSTFVFESSDCLYDSLKKIEWEGIGERRAEGFGRVAFNWLSPPVLTVDRTAKRLPNSIRQLSPDSEDALIARQMSERLLRQRLDALTSKQANTVMRAFDLRSLRKSQIGRLRDLLHDELMKLTPNPNQILDYMKKVEKRSSARKQFENARVGNKPLSVWIKEKLSHGSESDIRQLLGFQASDLRKIGGVAADFSESLRHEYLLRYIDAVLARAAKQGQ